MLSDVGGRLMFTAPKTKGPRPGVGLSARVVAAFERQRSRQAVARAEWAEWLRGPRSGVRSGQWGTVAAGLGTGPLPGTHRAVPAAAGAAAHLRHLAATLMLTEGVPLALASKVLRHATSGITVDLYGNLTAEAALAAADSLGTVLDAAAAELAAERVTRAGASSPSESGPRRVLQGVPSGLSLARARPDVERGPAGGAAQNRRCDRRTRSRQTCGCSSRRVGIVC